MIYLGADHGGFDLKEKIKKWLTEWGYQWEDLGNKEYKENDDYPQYAFSVASKVAENGGARGVLICRSAVGMVIAANKVKGTKAVACYDAGMARLSREHNDTNILALSADLSDEEQVKEILKTWLTMEFSGEERHVRRLEQIEKFEGIGE